MKLSDEEKKVIKKDLKRFFVLMISFGIAGTVVFLIGITAL